MSIYENHNSNTSFIQATHDVQLVHYTIRLTKAQTTEMIKNITKLSIYSFTNHLLTGKQTKRLQNQHLTRTVTKPTEDG